MFNHEAAAVDPKTSIIYQTEDTGNSGFFRAVMGAHLKLPNCGMANIEMVNDLQLALNYKTLWMKKNTTR